MGDSDSTDNLLIQSDVARLKGVTRQTVSLAIKEGRLPFVDKDGRKYVRREDAEAWSPLVDIHDRARYGMEVRWQGHVKSVQVRGPLKKRGPKPKQRPVPVIENPYLDSVATESEITPAEAKKRARPKKLINKIRKSA